MLEGFLISSNLQMQITKLEFDLKLKFWIWVTYSSTSALMQILNVYLSCHKKVSPIELL